MGTKNQLTRKDLEVLYKYTDLLQKKVPNAMKKAIMAVYEYAADDPYLSQKVWQRKRALLQAEKTHELFATAGVSKLEIAHKLKELMEAENPVVYKGQISKDENGNIVTVPDHQTQIRAVGYAANILGLEQKQQTADLSRQPRNLIVIVEDETSARRRVAQANERQVKQESYTVTGEDE